MGDAVEPTQPPSLRRRRRSPRAAPAGWRRPRRRRPRAPGTAISPSRSRTSKSASASHDLDVALVVGVAAGVQQRGWPRSRLALEEPGAEPALGRRGHQHAACPTALTCAARSVHQPSASPIFAPVQSSTAATDPVGRVEQQLEADRAADRVAGVGERPPGSPRSVEHVVDECQHAGGQLGHGEAVADTGSGCGRARAGPSATTSKRSARPAAHARPQGGGRRAERRTEHQQRQPAGSGVAQLRRR